LDVAGTRASGRLLIVPGGFQGELGVAGGGWDGTIALRPVGAIQQVEARLTAANAKLPGGVTVRRGRLDLTTLLDPAGARIDAQASGVGLARGALRLARFGGSARLVGGTGEVRATASGTRGRAFDLSTVVQVAPDRYVVNAQGTLDRRPIRLLEPAVVTFGAGGWQLPRARLSFAGGEATIGGTFGNNGLRVDASLARMPLAVLDIGYPGLGLGGAASGTLAYSAAPDAAPTGRLDMTVRGLSRSGLVLTSRPIDLGVAAVLDAQRLGVRAVAASGGRTVGRAQALLRPQGTGDLVQRLAAAPLTAQLRYGGPADTLWRLTGVELFDLSGPVSIAADVGGRLDAPRIRGAVQAQGARIESTTTGTVLTDVAASGRFDGSRLQIDRFAGQAGRDGRVTGAGAFDFAAPRGIGMDLRLVATRAAMINRDDVAATITGPLTFRSDGRGGNWAVRPPPPPRRASTCARSMRRRAPRRTTRRARPGPWRCARAAPAGCS
jgi:translocation and assembly module TamB